MTDDPTDGLRSFLIARWADESQHAHNALEWLDGEKWTAILPEQEWLANKPAAPLTVRLFVGQQSPQHVVDDLAAKARILADHAPDDPVTPECTRCGGERIDVDMPSGRILAVREPLAWPCPTVRLLALPYREHPDYQPEWAPET